MTAQRNNNPYRRMTGNVSGAHHGSAVGAGAHDARASQAECRPGPARPASLTADLRWPPPAGAHEPRGAGEPIPIWLAALIASRCQVSRNGQDRAVRWRCVSGRATYTNAGSEAELIEPLGVCLESGHTLAVTWAPGQSEYTLEVFGHLALRVG